MFYVGLKQLPEQEAYRLRDASVDWLNSNLLATEADFVLGPLLAWSPEALDGREGELLTLAMGWLRLHATEPDAKFVFDPLLDKWPRERLGKTANEELLKLAMAWLRLHIRESGTDFMIKRLLGRRRTRISKVEGELIGLAIVWLREHINESDAGFVLQPLLEIGLQRYFGEAEIEDELLDLSLEWLTEFGRTPDAWYVLSSLLLLDGLSPENCRLWSMRALELIDERQLHGDETYLLETLLLLLRHTPREVPWLEILIRTGKWLDEHRSRPEIGYVFANLLRISWLPDDVWSKIANAALEDLEFHAATDRLNEFVLNGVMDPLILWARSSKSAG